MFKDVLSNFFGWTASFLSVVFFILPGKLIWNLVNKKQDSSTVPYLVFVTTALNSYLWTNYGLKMNLSQVWVCNLFGSFISTFLIVVFCIHIVDYDIKNSAIVTFAIIGGAILINYYLYTYIPTGLIGFIAMIITACMWASPSQKIVNI